MRRDSTYSVVIPSFSIPFCSPTPIATRIIRFALLVDSRLVLQACSTTLLAHQSGPSMSRMIGTWSDAPPAESLSAQARSAEGEEQRTDLGADLASLDLREESLGDLRGSLQHEEASQQQTELTT